MWDQISTARRLAILALVAFAGLRIAAAVRQPLTWPDTKTYFALNFLGGTERPWTVPLAWTLFPSNGLRVALQVAVGIIAWSLLAVSLAWILTSLTVRTVAIVIVLLLGVLPPVAGWDATMLSESLSTSLLVALVALLLLLTRTQSGRLLAGSLAVAVLWVFARQTNTLLYLALLPFVLAFALWRLPGRRATMIGVALLLLGVWSGYAITRPASSGPWKENAIVIIGDRIAGDRAAVAVFEASGLPHVAMLRPHSEVAVDRNIVTLHADKRVMAWIAASFRSTYFAYLRRHWARAVWRSISEAAGHVSSHSSASRGRAVLPGAVDDGLWRLSPAAIAAVLALTVLLVAIAWVVTGAFRGLALLAALLATTVIGAVIIGNATDPAMDWLDSSFRWRSSGA